MTRRARIIRRRLRFGPTLARVFALVILTVLAVIALASSTNSATKLYKESSQTKKEADLKGAVEELNFWKDRLETLGSVDSNSELNKGFVPNDHPDYIESEVTGQSAQKP